MYILLELCEYATLHELIKRRDHLSEMETRYFCVQLIDALKLIHAKGIIHRDLKPGNVMMAKDMQLKIGDFGLATRWKRGERRRSYCGTPGWFAPEIVKNRCNPHTGQYLYGGSGLDYD